MNPENFLRHHILSLPAYTPIEPFEVLSQRMGRQPSDITKLDANENPYGPAPAARAALVNLEYPHIYPDPESRLLRQAIARFTGIDESLLLAGAGADELIDLVLRVTLDPGDKIINCPPTFGMYSFDALVNAGEVIDIPRKPDFTIDVPAIRDAVTAEQPKLVFLTSPNNPDGSMISPDDLAEILDLPVLVILDEAYIEFADDQLGQISSNIARVPSTNNLIVLRTFSKWAGLAGLRVGYGAFPGWMMPYLWTAKQPYNVNVAAAQTAIASLDDKETLRTSVATLRSSRANLFTLLESLPMLTPYPSQANFILCRVSGLTAQTLKQRLATDYGILVRYFNKPGLTDCIRISIGTPQQIDKLTEALNTIQTEVSSAAYS